MPSFKTRDILLLFPSLFLPLCLSFSFSLSLSSSLFSSPLFPNSFPRRNECAHCDVSRRRLTKSAIILSSVRSYTLIIHDHAIDGRHLSASRSDANRSFDEETRAICRAHDACRNFIRQTRMLFFVARLAVNHKRLTRNTFR